MSHDRSPEVPGADTVPRRARNGRGALSNADGRFESYRHEPVDDGWNNLDEPVPALRTAVSVDCSRTVIARNDSPDIPFDRSINPYRGCEHGCIYCYARPSHAYLGLSPGLDFETRLYAKAGAERLLKQVLAREDYRVATIALGSNTDPYQPVERRLGITRRILEILVAHDHPLMIVTKSALVERDLDIIAPMAARNLVAVHLSITTLDRGLARRLEPRATAPDRRVETIHALRSCGVPVGVMVAPVIPGLTDPEMERVLERAAEAGARFAGYVLLRLPHEVKDLFKEWLAANEPLKAVRVMSLVRASRGGREDDPRFGSRMTGTGEYALMLRRRFDLACRRMGLRREHPALDHTRFRSLPEAGAQMKLFA